MFSKTGSDYLGPIDVDLPQLNRLDFGSSLDQFTVKIKNENTDSQAVSMRVLGNPSGLYYPNPDVTANTDYLPLTAPLDLAIDEEKRLSLGIRRADFPLAEFNHILQITSAAGARWLVPVTATAAGVSGGLWGGQCHH